MVPEFNFNWLEFPIVHVSHMVGTAKFTLLVWENKTDFEAQCTKTQKLTLYNFEFVGEVSDQTCFF